MNRRRAALVVGTLGLLFGAGAAGYAVAPSNTTSAKSASQNNAVDAVTVDGYQSPPIKHVWMIMLENKSYEASFTGLNQNSYLWKTLTSQGALLRQYYGTGHYSEDNYLSAVSGQAPTPDTQHDCPVYQDVTPGTPAPDGQTYAAAGCVYPARVLTLFNQLDAAHVSWKGYMQSMGNDTSREPTTCGAPPGSPASAGVANQQRAETQDQYLPKHNPFVWFHAIIDTPECKARVVPLDGRAVSTGHPAINGLAGDLAREATTPAFSWITPDMCSDAHDATCVGTNLDGTHQGGLLAADQFLAKYIPMIEKSSAFQHNGLIEVTFDEGFPPYQVFGNSIADLPPVPGVDDGSSLPNPTTPADPANTAQSVVACCNEVSGPNVAYAGAQAFGQDTTPGGGITGAVLLSRYVTPGTISDQPYNHYSWLRSMEDLFAVTKGGTDGHGHLGYAATASLRPFGPDVYNNPSGLVDTLEKTPAGPGTNGIYAARTGSIGSDAPTARKAGGRPVPDSRLRPAGDPYPEPPFPATLPGTVP
ncbi:MAG TPA: alkaline phosphatase family protein [Nakamurella sp.]|nr:alkaline phosphatase family protein [Nakamurella sp.]